MNTQITKNYGGHRITVSSEDEILLQEYHWCLIHSGHKTYVSSTIPGGAKRNLYLHRVIATRAGLDPGYRVEFKDGNELNLTRQNLIQSTRRTTNSTGVPRQVYKPTQPVEIHRHRLGTERPATRYEICAGIRSGTGKTVQCPNRVRVGMTIRLTGGGWAAEDRQGTELSFDRHTDAMEWLSTQVGEAA